MFNWIIVGGGIQGTYLSNHLLRSGLGDLDNIKVIDPQLEPFSTWKARTRNVCMEFLRSPAEHNLDHGLQAIYKFAHEAGLGKKAFYSKYNRPSLALFNAHCDHVVAKNGLGEMRLQSECLSISQKSGVYQVETNSGCLAAQRVILALGDSNVLHVPLWAKDKTLEKSPLVHCFSRRMDELKEQQWENVAVIGAGISGVQIANWMARKNPGKVTLLHAQPLRVSRFDAAGCWLDSKCQRFLNKHSDFSIRRRVVDNARNKGTVPVEIEDELNENVRLGYLKTILAQILKAGGDSKSVKIELSTGETMRFDLVIFATGFDRCLPGGNLLKGLVNELCLPTAQCGFPIVDKYLQWSKDLFVAGSLAELELGPAARNIIGGRLVAERIVERVRPRKSKPKEYNYGKFRRKRAGL